MEMQIDDIKKRVTELRMKKGVSARDMSLSIGMGEAYISNLENGKAMPSVEVLFYICEYFNINEFDEDIKEPTKAYEVYQLIKKLSDNQLDVIKAMVEQMK